MSGTNEMQTPLDRLLAKTEKREGGCWLWTGTLNRTGYGQLTVKVGGRYRTLFAHRVAYELLRGPIGDGLHVDHLCRVHNCVNPDHLEPVTCRENLLRGVGVNAVNARKTHCVNGHPFDVANTRWRRNGRRACRACSRAASARYQRAKAEARQPIAPKATCGRGHTFDDANTIFQRGGRKCRACARISGRKYRARQRAAAIGDS